MANFFFSARETFLEVMETLSHLTTTGQVARKKIGQNECLVGLKKRYC
jgi:hypothetical protein